MFPPSLALQAFFILSAATILTVSSFPALNARFVSYGSRQAESPPPNKPNDAKTGSVLEGSAYGTSFWSKLNDWFSGLQVPHHYFLHFYVVSVLSSVFWLFQFVTGGAALRSLCIRNMAVGVKTGMSFEQVLLSWSLMFIQGGRRLAESVVLLKPSSSTMWFVHWLLGITFYLGMGIAVWIDGPGDMLPRESVISSIRFSAPSAKALLGVPLFLMASGIQHDCHAYLATLPKYTLPQHPIFNTFVCPHYVAECLIYLALAIVSAPAGQPFNRTMFSAFVFVLVNLSVTASNTKAWYEKKFGKDKVTHRWIMVPSVW